jgi:hypothetical protein
MAFLKSPHPLAPAPRGLEGGQAQNSPPPTPPRGRGGKKFGCFAAQKRRKTPEPGESSQKPGVWGRFVALQRHKSPPGKISPLPSPNLGREGVGAWVGMSALEPSRGGGSKFRGVLRAKWPAKPLTPSARSRFSKKSNDFKKAIIYGVLFNFFGKIEPHPYSDPKEM